MSRIYRLRLPRRHHQPLLLHQILLRIKLKGEGGKRSGVSTGDVERMKSHDMQQGGFSQFELLAVIVLMSILLMSALPNLKALDTPLSQSSFSTSHLLRFSRARAISTTSHIRVTPASSRILATYSASSCSPDASLSLIEGLSIELEEEVILEAQDWYICFTPRGFSDAHITFSFTNGFQSRSIQVALGGGVRID